MGCIFGKMDTFIAHRLALILDSMFVGIAGDAIGREPFFSGEGVGRLHRPYGALFT